MEKTALLEFQYSPYPLKQNYTDHGVPFFDVSDYGRRGHTSSRGGVYWEDTVYADRRVLLSLSKNFNPKKNPYIILYLHGNQNVLERDLLARQNLPAQVSNSGINALFVAPQLAYDALDSSAGNFVDAEFLAKFMEEVAVRTSQWQKNKALKSILLRAPVIVIAFSGGYIPASYILERGDISKRVKGVLLLDALYSREETFSEWMAGAGKSVFFFSAYTQSTRSNNVKLQHELGTYCIKYRHDVPKSITSGQIIFMDLGDDLNHNDLPSMAWEADPITDFLARIKAGKYTSGMGIYRAPVKPAGCRKK